MADFEQDISKWCAQAEGRVQMFVVALALNVQSYIQNRTPVLTGRLRASIQPIKPLNSWQPGEDIVIGTNVEYGRRIEYGFAGVDSLGRHYNQKGVGMFTQAANAFDSIAEATLRQIGSSDNGTMALGTEDIIEELYDILSGGALTAAYHSMGTAMSGFEAYAESMASIAEAAAEFGI